MASKEEQSGPGASDPGKPIAVRVTCYVCGKYRIVEPMEWVGAHLDMRQHVFAAHGTAEYDIDGEPVTHGYGWTDNYVAVLFLYTQDEVKNANRPTEEFFKEEGTE